MSHWQKYASVYLYALLITEFENMTAAQEAGTTLMALLNKSFSQAQSAPAPVQPPEVKP